MASGRIVLPGIADPCLSSTGELQSGATLTVTIAGSPTLASLFADAALATPITNPQTSDSAGRFDAQTTTIWADASQAYDLALSFPDGEEFTFLTQFTLGAQNNTSGFAPINSPALTGVPTAPTPATNDSSSKLATTAFVKNQQYATLASPTIFDATLTGVPVAPTAAAGTDTTQIATTAYVFDALGVTIPVTTTSGTIKVAGIMVQWQAFSLGSATGSSQAINWPTPFTTRLFGTPWTAAIVNAAEQIGVTSPTISGCTVQKGAGDGGARTGTVWAVGQ